MKKLTKVKENGPQHWCIPPLKATDSKYTRGHVLVLGGAQMTGAARLAALAAQRAGAGLVTIAATKTSWPIYAASMLSVIARSCTAAEWQALVNDERINPVLIGPGAGVNARTKHALLTAAKAGKHLLLDADALTLLANDAALRKVIINSARKMDSPRIYPSANSGNDGVRCTSRATRHSLNPSSDSKGIQLIITPHEGEYTRLAKALKLDTSAEKSQRAVALAKALRAVVVLKGSDTFIADAEGNLLVTHPPAWLASGGTGDVLAGIIAALVGQGMNLFNAAAAGVWLHAQAARGFGPGMIAEDVIGALPHILGNLH